MEKVICAKESSTLMKSEKMEKGHNINNKLYNINNKLWHKTKENEKIKGKQ